MSPSGQASRPEWRPLRTKWTVSMVDLLLVALALGWKPDGSRSEAAQTQGCVEAPDVPLNKTTPKGLSPVCPFPSERSSSREPKRLLSAVSSKVVWSSALGRCNERVSTEVSRHQVVIAATEKSELRWRSTPDSGITRRVDEQLVHDTTALCASGSNSLVWAAATIDGPCDQATASGVATLVCSNGSLRFVNGRAVSPYNNSGESSVGLHRTLDFLQGTGFIGQ